MAWESIPLLSTDPDFEKFYGFVKNNLEFLYASMSETSPRYITIPYSGEAVAGDSLDGLIITAALTVTHYSVSIRRASGADTKYDIMKNGVPLSKVATIDAGDEYLATAITVDIAFAASDRLGVKIITAGSGPLAEGILFCVIYKPA